MPLKIAYRGIRQKSQKAVVRIELTNSKLCSSCSPTLKAKEEDLSKEISLLMLTKTYIPKENS